MLSWRLHNLLLADIFWLILDFQEQDKVCVVIYLKLQSLLFVSVVFSVVLLALTFQF